MTRMLERDAGGDVSGPHCKELRAKGLEAPVITAAPGEKAGTFEVNRKLENQRGIENKYKEEANGIFTVENHRSQN